MKIIVYLWKTGFVKFNLYEKYLNKDILYIYIMPFILPTFILLNKAPTIQKSIPYRVKFLKNIFYFRVVSYFSFFTGNQLLPLII